MEDIPRFNPSEFQVQPPYFDIRVPPLNPVFTSPSGDPSKAPNFDDMKVKRGDIITADAVNEMVGAMEALYNRIQDLEKIAQQSLVNRPGRVMEVEGIGRRRWERLVKEGIVTLYDLGKRSSKEIMNVLDIEDIETAKQIVSDAYELAGGRTGHPLTDLRSVGADKAGRLKQAGVKNLSDFATAEPGKIARVLNVEEAVAEDLKREAKSFIPRHSKS